MTWQETQGDGRREVPEASRWSESALNLIYCMIWPNNWYLNHGNTEYSKLSNRHILIDNSRLQWLRFLVLYKLNEYLLCIWVLYGSNLLFSKVRVSNRSLQAFLNSYSCPLRFRQWIKYCVCFRYWMMMSDKDLVQRWTCQRLPLLCHWRMETLSKVVTS